MRSPLSFPPSPEDRDRNPIPSSFLRTIASPAPGPLSSKGEKKKKERREEKGGGEEGGKRGGKEGEGGEKKREEKEEKEEKKKRRRNIPSKSFKNPFEILPKPSQKRPRTLPEPSFKTEPVRKSFFINFFHFFEGPGSPKIPAKSKKMLKS